MQEEVRVQTVEWGERGGHSWGAQEEGGSIICPRVRSWLVRSCLLLPLREAELTFWKRG